GILQYPKLCIAAHNRPDLPVHTRSLRSSLLRVRTKTVTYLVDRLEKDSHQNRNGRTIRQHRQRHGSSVVPCAAFHANVPVRLFHHIDLHTCGGMPCSLKSIV